jgi:hypothetical protein
MSFRIGWDYPALAVFPKVHWPASADVDAAIQRFAAERAPLVPSGAYRIRTAGYEIAVRVDRKAGTLLVLHIYRPR